MNFKESKELAEKFIIKWPVKQDEYELAKAHLAALDRIEELEERAEWEPTVDAQIKRIEELESLLGEVQIKLAGRSWGKELAEKIRKTLDAKT